MGAFEKTSFQIDGVSPIRHTDDPQIPGAELRGFVDPGVTQARYFVERGDVEGMFLQYHAQEPRFIASGRWF